MLFLDLDFWGALTRTVPNECCHMVGGLRLLLLAYLFIFLTVSALMLLLPLLLEYDAEQNVWEHFNLHAMYFTQTFLGIKPKSWVLRRAMVFWIRTISNDHENAWQVPHPWSHSLHWVRNSGSVTNLTPTSPKSVVDSLGKTTHLQKMWRLSEVIPCYPKLLVSGAEELKRCRM